MRRNGVRLDRLPKPIDGIDDFQWSLIVLIPTAYSSTARCRDVCGRARRNFWRVLVALALLGSCATVRAAPPDVTISYSPLLDTVCSFVRWYRIESAWKSELSSDIRRFRQMWAATGPKLLEAAERITGRPFTRRHITAHLTLCNLPSQSIVGISVNMRYALHSFTAHPVPLRYKVGVLYHEILHRYVDEYLPVHSPLLARYANEPSRVRKHLHLFALEKAVYLSLGMKSALAETIAVDNRLPDGSYARAWQIVNQGDDDYLAYVAELKAKGHR